MQTTLRFISILYVLLLSVGLFAHVEIIPALLSTLKRNAWISIVPTFLILIIWSFFLYKIVSITKQQSIIKFIQDNGQKYTYYLLLFPIGIYLILNALITARDIIFWSQLSYMQEYSSFPLAIILFLFCLFCTLSGFFSIGILSSLLCPIVVFLGFFISLANVKKKHYELLFPLLTDGYIPLIKGLLYSSLPVMELFIIIFLTPILKKTISMKQILIAGILILFLMLGPTIGAIIEFGPDQAVKYRYPAFEQWRIISIGRYFSHADFFAVFQWLSGGVIRISLFILIACNIFTKGMKSMKVILFIYGILIIGCLVPIDQSMFSEIIYRFYRPFSFFFLTILIVSITIYISWNKKNIAERRSE